MASCPTGSVSPGEEIDAARKRPGWLVPKEKAARGESVGQLPIASSRREASDHWIWSERVLTSVVASSALIIAACVSGLSAVTCAAMAESYESAIDTFGELALLSLWTLAFVAAAARLSAEINLRGPKGLLV